MQLYVKKRSGTVEEFDKNKIVLALLSTMESVEKKGFERSQDFFEKLSNKIKNEIFSIHKDGNIIEIDDLEKIIEKKLGEDNELELFRQYILFSEEKKQKIKKTSEKIQKKIENETLKVIKFNGDKEIFNIEKLKNTFNLAAKGYKKYCKFSEIEEKIKKSLIDNIKTEEIHNILTKIILDQIDVKNIKWQNIAGRLSLFDLYKKAARNRNMKPSQIYRKDKFIELIDEYIEKGLYYKDFYKYYSKEDFEKAAEHLEKSRDWNYTYSIMTMYKKRYLLNPNKIIKELPQEMYMMAALFLAIPEKEENRFSTAIKIYDYTSTGKISLPTPTLLNARTNYHQLSSCFKLNVDDDLRSIYHNIENMAQISKFGGGIGVYLGNIRAKGSSIRGYKGAAGGVNPWIKVINDTAIAVNQLGARAGAISVTLDAFHLDIFHFLDLQTEAGDIRSKSFDVFPSISFPDLFFERYQNGENFTLFDPKEVEDVTGKRLQDHFGHEFEKFYIECENNSKITMKKTIEAKEIWKSFLKTVVETGMPYAFFRDTVNDLNPNKHSGNVYSSQLCCEISQNTAPSKFIEEALEDGKIVIKYEPGDSVVCNLASVNVAKVNTKEEIENVIPVAMRLLDNVITLNFYPIKEAEITAKKYRSVGLGFLGLAEYLATNKLAYDSKEAREEVDKLFEKYAYETIKASNQNAIEKGKYELFDGSEWSKGIFFGKNEKWFNENSNMKKEWIELIKNVKKYGIRNGYLLSPAPNTSSALVIGTTASVLPIYKKYFVETNSISPSINVAPNLNDENYWYYKEYINLNLNDVIDMISVIYKWIDQNVSFEYLINPEKTSPKDLSNYYLKTWKQKIKTVYYVRSMNLEVKECISCSG